ncbi:bacillithiol system protein YtxJ [Filibacter limicola]|uniref:Bacillithiol system protein YtxJ n=1 Tax=Sporosarcina limicola TaxID=34101 RepID=A0A927MG44_9BACL|nr:bacillithiol system protein YtxJ [Sporosarcina limicola]
MKEIRVVNEWRDVLEQSREQPVFVLKHSATCPISASAYREFKAFETDLEKNYLIVQDSRSVSNEIEDDLGIQHQSPQLFLLKDGKAIWQATHYEINKGKIKNAVEDFC